MQKSTDTKRILLLIEDNVSLAELYKEAFIEHGIQVNIANDGETGIHLAKTKHPNIILLDFMLPDMSGIEVLKTLKDDATTKDIKVVFLTINDEPEDQEHARELGAIDFLVKQKLHLEDIVKRVIAHLSA